MNETSVSRFEDRVASDPERPALRLLAGGGARQDVRLTRAGWSDRSRAFAAALLAEGVRPGDRVAVLAGNTLLWPIAELGIHAVGAVSVGVYPDAPVAQVRGLLRDCDARLLFVDTDERRRVAAAAVEGLPRACRVVLEPSDDQGASPPWLESGRRSLADPALRAALDDRRRSLRPQDPAAIVYTSGSTGEPKGAILPHEYLVASTESIRATLGLCDTDSALSFLPYAHTAERVFGLHTRIHAGMETGLIPNHHRVWEAARDFRPTVFGGLPRFFEKVAEALERAGAELSDEARDRWNRGLELGRRRSELRRAGRPVPRPLQDDWWRASAPLRRVVADHLGDRLRIASSGGAPLPRDAAELLDAAGLSVLGAYGLTEHLCVAFHRPDRYDFRSSGRPMPGTTLRVADDGELLVRRGPLTFSGYLGRPEDSAAAFSADGRWLCTGDLGEVGDDGTISVTGRKKDLIALSTGKKVAPAAIEARLARHPRIAHAVVCGEGRKFVSALLFVRGNGDDGTGPPAVCSEPELVSEMDALVAEVSVDLSGPERIRRFLLLDGELRPERGELTPTLKVRRTAVETGYRELLDTLYAREAP